MELREVAAKLSQEGIFTRGPPDLFESGGRLQLVTLLREGLLPDSKVLDVGCGCLRAGYWLIRFLDAGCYFGIEPNANMLSRGSEYLLNPDLISAKRPRFDNNDRFDFSVFETKFDVALARSIWTHASKAQICKMLDGFAANSRPRSFFLTSYLPASRFALRRHDYKGEAWIGRSHKDPTPGLVYHNPRWIRSECAKRGLHVRQLRYGAFNNQHWLKISAEKTVLQDQGYRME